MEAGTEMPDEFQPFTVLSLRGVLLLNILRLAHVGAEQKGSKEL